MRAGLTVCCLVMTAIASACGGRSMPGDDEAPDSGGRKSSGGSNVAGTKVGAGGRGGAGSGGAGVGGVATAGTSQVVCNDIPCLAIGCGAGHHTELPPGQCCPVCVRDSCADQQLDYAQVREQLLEKYSEISCVTSDECVLYYENNACANGCGIPIAGSIVGSLEVNLKSAAAEICSPECMPNVPPCLPPAAPLCFQNRCR